MNKPVLRGTWVAGLIVATGMGAALQHATPVSAGAGWDVTTVPWLCRQVITHHAGQMHISYDCCMLPGVVAAPLRHGLQDPRRCAPASASHGSRRHSHSR